VIPTVTMRFGPDAATIGFVLQSSQVPESAVGAAAPPEAASTPAGATPAMRSPVTRADAILFIRAAPFQGCLEGCVAA